MWEPTERSIPEWETILQGLEESLEGVLLLIDQGRANESRPDVLTLDAFDELDSYLSAQKRDLGM